MPLGLPEAPRRFGRTITYQLWAASRFIERCRDGTLHEWEFPPDPLRTMLLITANPVWPKERLNIEQELNDESVTFIFAPSGAPPSGPRRS